LRPAVRGVSLKPQNKMDWKLILAGVGGQGIVFASSVFSETALARGYDMLGSETHGMSQRGGSVIAHLKIGPYQSPLIREGTADVLLSFDEDEAYRTLAFVRPGGLCFINTPRGDFWDPRVKAYLERNSIGARSLAADSIAMELGSPRSANLALIGYAVGTPQVPFDHDEIRATIERLSPARWREVNLKAYEAGYRRKQ
jgi:indolepyruvate ferredoxin oxidoreductase beta subunit